MKPDVSIKTQMCIKRSMCENVQSFLQERGQNAASGQRLSLDDNNQMTEMIRKIVRSGRLDQSLVEVNRNRFTPNIRNARNSSDFKLPTLEMYNVKTDPTVHLMRYVRHMEVLDVSEEVMDQCFPLYPKDLAAMWFRRL